MTTGDDGRSDGRRQRRRARGEGTIFQRASDDQWVVRLDLGYGQGRRKRVTRYARTEGAALEGLKRLTIDTPEARAGLACTSCHAVTHVQGSMGQGGLTVEYPALHELMSEREDLHGVHPLADQIAESLRWSA